MGIFKFYHSFIYLLDIFHEEKPLLINYLGYQAVQFVYIRQDKCLVRSFDLSGFKMIAGSLVSSQSNQWDFFTCLYSSIMNSYLMHLNTLQLLSLLLLRLFHQMCYFFPPSDALLKFKVC